MKIFLFILLALIIGFYGGAKMNDRLQAKINQAEQSAVQTQHQAQLRACGEALENCRYLKGE